jgi:tetratricopeptide (TPR) repeat protein
LRGNPARLTEAERMYGQILSDIGDDRSELAQGIRHNLASVLFHQGKLADAEAAFRQVLSGRAQTLGDEHPSFLITRSNLAAALNARGRLAESEGHTRAVLAVQRRVLGTAHPDSLDSQVNLAAIVANQGRVAEALPLLTAAIEGYRTTHGPDHPMLVELTAIQSRLRGHS